MNFSKLTNFGSAMSVRQGSSLHSGRSLAALAVDKGEKYAAAAAFGFLKGYYREKAMFLGQPVDLLAGLGLTVAGAVVNMYSEGRSNIAPHLERIGDAGMMSYFNSMGAAYGNKAAGRVVSVSPAGAMLPRGATPVLGELPSVIGEIPPAVAGAYLTADEIARFANVRA
jgi:hypothetical protein